MFYKFLKLESVYRTILFVVLKYSKMLHTYVTYEITVSIIKIQHTLMAHLFCRKIPKNTSCRENGNRRNRNTSTNTNTTSSISKHKPCKSRCGKREIVISNCIKRTVQTLIFIISVHNKAQIRNKSKIK